MSKFVRLKPYNPRRGFVVQRHGIGEMFFLGGVRPNWYEVSDDVAAMLGQKRQFHTDPDSKPLFDIMDKEEKERVAAEEQNQVLAQLGAIGQTVAMPQELRDQVTDVLLAIMNTPEGQQAVETVFSWEALEKHDDTFYDPFRELLQNAGMSIEELISYY